MALLFPTTVNTFYVHQIKPRHYLHLVRQNVHATNVSLFFFQKREEKEKEEKYKNTKDPNKTVR